MKKNFLLLACTVLAIAACKKDDPAPEPTEGGLSCTIAMYSSGGGTSDNGVDIDYVNELIEAMKVGPTEKIKLIAQQNFDGSYPTLSYITGTSVMRLLQKNEDISYIYKSDLNFKGCKTKADSNQVRAVAINAKLKEIVDSGAYSFEKVNGSNRVKLYLPSEISKFLDKAAKDCPSDHYFLSIEGHGGGWSAKDDREMTKAVAYDNSWLDSLGISAKNLVAGINASSIASKIPVLYMNACQMNFLENICEYAACPVTYAMVSFKNTTGTDFQVIMNDMQATQGNTVSDLLNTLVKSNEKIYASEKKKCDISFVNIKSMKAAAMGVKDLVPLLKDDYKADHKWYNDEIAALESPDGESSGTDRDFSQFLADLVNEENIDKDIKTSASSIRTNIQNSIVKTIYGDSCSVKKNLLAGVKFIGKNSYTKSRTNKEYADAYDNNAFYSATKWNTLFELFDDKIND